jgi:hypothetical protein
MYQIGGISKWLNHDMLNQSQEQQNSGDGSGVDILTLMDTVLYYAPIIRFRIANIMLKLRDNSSA